MRLQARLLCHTRQSINQLTSKDHRSTRTHLKNLLRDTLLGELEAVHGRHVEAGQDGEQRTEVVQVIQLVADLDEPREPAARASASLRLLSAGSSWSTPAAA